MKDVMKMSILRLAVMVAIALTQDISFGQVEYSDPPGLSQSRIFEVDAISFAGNDKVTARLDILIQVGYNSLSFVKKGDKYSASYEMTIVLRDSAQAFVAEKIWTEEIKGITFEQSVSTAYSLVSRSFDVNPGHYFFSATMRDIETKSSRRLDKKITVPDYSTEFSLSDIMLVSKLVVKGDKKNIVPRISPNVGGLENFYLFFEANNGGTLDSVKFVTSILNEKKEKVKTHDTLEVLTKGRNQIILGVDNSGLTLGNYTVVVQAFRSQDSATSELTPLGSTNRTFLIRWGGMLSYLKDIDLAIDQLRYIAKESELVHIRQGKDIEEKQKRFVEFWKKRDPNPNTPRNEKMELYYARVEYSNLHFKHYIDGWRTDMGMIYIMFGPPNNVERRPFEGNTKPFEIWSYYEYNYDFVFVDNSGFGDYRLTNPVWNTQIRPKDY